MRVWKLGSLEHGIYPTKEAVEKLENLLSIPGITDLIWGPDLEVITLDGEDVNIIEIETFCKEYLEKQGYIVTTKDEIAKIIFKYNIDNSATLDVDLFKEIKRCQDELDV